MTNSFLQKIKSHAISAYKTSSILPSVLAAQAILETGWGQSELARNANNLFGIKGSYNGQSYTVRTREEDANGKSFYVNAAFRKYPSYKESFIDRAAFFTSSDWRKQVYKDVINATDYVSQVKALDASPYATDQQYGTKLLRIINENKLYEWDNNHSERTERTVGYQLINAWTPSSMYHIKSPRAMTPKTITIHDTGNTASADNESRYMDSNNNPTSYHVVIDNEKVIQKIPFNRIAWAAGDGAWGSGNSSSIHIETSYSMDNGYYGKMSERYIQARINTAEYVAYVLIQYGWGVGHLRQHYDWSRKDCPHKLRNTSSWNWFKNLVQQYMNEIKGGKKESAPKPVESTPKANAQKATNGSYTVKKGDTLYGIATANKTTVDALKQLNGLKSNVLSIGQKLKVKKVSTSRDRSTWGWHWSGTFTVTAKDGVAVYRGGPGIKAKNLVDTGSFLKKGQFVNFDHIFMIDGYWWIRFKYAEKGSSTDYFFAPIGRKLSGIGFATANKKKQLWGTVTKLNANENKSGVKNWRVKEAVA